MYDMTNDIRKTQNPSYQYTDFTDAKLWPDYKIMICQILFSEYSAFQDK